MYIEQTKLYLIIIVLWVGSKLSSLLLLLLSLEVKTSISQLELDVNSLISDGISLIYVIIIIIIIDVVVDKWASFVFNPQLGPSLRRKARIDY